MNNDMIYCPIRKSFCCREKCALWIAYDLSDPNPDNRGACVFCDIRETIQDIRDYLEPIEP